MAYVLFLVKKILHTVTDKDFAKHKEQLLLLVFSRSKDLTLYYCTINVQYIYLKILFHEDTKHVTINCIMMSHLKVVYKTMQCIS